MLSNNGEKSVDLLIGKKIQKAGNRSQKLPESFEELRDKHPKLYEIVVRNRRDIEAGLKDIVLDINPNANVNSSSLSIPDLGYKSGSESLTQEEKGINDNNYESEKSEIDVEYYRLSNKRHTVDDSRIELDNIELIKVEEQNSILSMRMKDQRKGTGNVYELEKKRRINNCFLSKSEAESREIQVIIENLTLQQDTKNYAGANAKVKSNRLDTDYRNEKNLRIGKQPHLPILGSGNNKQEHIR